MHGRSRRFRRCYMGRCLGCHGRHNRASCGCVSSLYTADGRRCRGGHWRLDAGADGLLGRRTLLCEAGVGSLARCWLCGRLSPSQLRRACRNGDRLRDCGICDRAGAAMQDG